MEGECHMPILIILGILAIYFIADIYETLTKDTQVLTHEEMEQMMEEMIGKSEKERKKITKSYIKNRNKK